MNSEEISVNKEAGDSHIEKLEMENEQATKERQIDDKIADCVKMLSRKLLIEHPDENDLILKRRGVKRTQDDLALLDLQKDKPIIILNGRLTWAAYGETEQKRKKRMRRDSC